MSSQFAFKVLKEMELFARRPINGSRGWPPKQRTINRSDLVVKEQVVLRQMFVCYESILTAESSAFL